MNRPDERGRAEELVEWLYLALLDRRPDPTGMRHYADGLSRGDLTPRDVGRAIVGSAEFKALNPLAATGAGLVVEVRPPPTPPGVDRETILRMLVSVTIDNAAAGELETYAREDCDRFLHTLDLTPAGEGALLEIGANPYFMSLLLKAFRPRLAATRVNYFGGPVGWASQTVTATGLGGGAETHRFDYLNANIEAHALPFEDGAFDVVLYCEVLEHMTDDPLRSLLELKRLLRPGGKLILTTPNVARLENVARLASGANIYDPYSGYGPYGRHNREYTRHELCRLMAFCGFSEDVVFTADVHDNRAGHFLDPDRLAPLLSARLADLGQYLFSRWTNAGPPPPRKPGWLYRSYPPTALDPGEL